MWCRNEGKAWTGTQPNAYWLLLIYAKLSQPPVGLSRGAITGVFFLDQSQSLASAGNYSQLTGTNSPSKV